MLSAALCAGEQVIWIDLDITSSSASRSSKREHPVESSGLDEDFILHKERAFSISPVWCAVMGAASR